MRRLGILGGGMFAALAVAVRPMFAPMRYADAPKLPMLAPCTSNARNGRANNPRGTVSNRGLRRIQGRQRARP